MRRSQLPTVRTWHVFTRGARRLALFYEDRDYRQFLFFLQEALILSGCQLFGYVLMGNHYHLMLRGAQAQLSLCMQRLNWRYALYHNDTHGLGGHVFDGPYKAYPQRSLKWLLWRLAYIFLNPVKGHLVDKAEDYPWSGYLSFMGKEGSPLNLAPLPELDLISSSLNEVRAHFVDIMKEQEARGAEQGATTPSASQIQLDQFDWVRRQAATRTQDLPEVSALDLAIYWGYELGIPPTLMARTLGLESRDAIRYRVRQLKKRLAADEDLARKLRL